MKYFKIFIILNVLGFINLSVQGQISWDFSTISRYNNQFNTSSYITCLQFSSRIPIYFNEVRTNFAPFEVRVDFSGLYFDPAVSFMVTERIKQLAKAKFSQYRFGYSCIFLDTLKQSLNTASCSKAEVLAFERCQSGLKLSVYSLEAFCKNQLYMPPHQYGVRRADYHYDFYGMGFKVAGQVRVGATYSRSSNLNFHSTFVIPSQSVGK